MTWKIDRHHLQPNPTDRLHCKVLVQNYRNFFTFDLQYEIRAYIENEVES